MIVVRTLTLIFHGLIREDEVKFFPSTGTRAPKYPELLGLVWSCDRAQIEIEHICLVSWSI